MSKKCCPNCGHFPATELHVCRGPETTAEQRTVKFWAARWQASQVELAGMATAWEDDRKTLSRKFEEIEGLQEKVADFAAANQELRRQRDQEISDHRLLQADFDDLKADAKLLEEERDSAKAHASKLVGELFGATADYSKAKIRAEKAEWQRFAVSLVLILVSTLVLCSRIFQR